MILVSGSLAYDQILDFPGKFSDHIMPDKLHILNVSFLVEKMRRGFGGTAGNIAYTLSLLGSECAVLGCAGVDFPPYKKFLAKRGVDTKYIKIHPYSNTSTAIGITDAKDNHIWGYHTGADDFSPNQSTKVVKEKLDFAIVAPQNPKAMLKFAREYTKNKISYMFDCGMQLRYFTGNDLMFGFKGAQVIIGNDYEISVMEKTAKIRSLHDKFPDKIIITTLGEKGSVISYKKRIYRIKPVKVKNPIDPAGAGDCYRAGFAAGLVRGFDIQTCGQMGSLAAKYTVEKYGTSTHFFTKKSFCGDYQKYFNQNLKI